jgi:hypothetical protein
VLPNREVEQIPGKMGNDSAGGRAILKLGGKRPELLCDVVKEDLPHVILEIRPGEPTTDVPVGGHVALLEHRAGQFRARAGTVASVTDGRIAIQLEPAARSLGDREPRLTDCQLPAMFRPLSATGHYGGWRGAIIVRHSPTRLHLQVEEGSAVPGEAELMFSPIGSDVGSSSRPLGEDGAIMNSSDVRSRRVRVRAMTRDVQPAPVSGAVTLVVDISRTLYRAS